MVDKRRNLKILLLTPVYPYPPNQGNRMDIWGQIEWFYKQGFELTVVFCNTISAIFNQEESKALPFEIPFRFLQWNPSSKNSVRNAKHQISQWIDEKHPDILLVHYHKLNSLIPKNLGRTQLWYRSHNFQVGHCWEKYLEHQLWQEYKGWQKLFKTFRWLIDFGRGLVHNFIDEFVIHRRADAIFYIGYRDWQIMKHLYQPSAPSYWLLPFLDLPAVDVKPGKKVLDVMYPGSNFINNVNLAGARKLIDEIAPFVEAKLPGRFRFHVIGQYAKDKLGETTNSYITIYNFIEDLDSFIQKMDVVCIPVPLGWGCKLKMIEALARGLPVLGAPETFRGVPLLNDSFWICRRPDDYVNAFRELLDPVVRNEYAQQSHKLYAQWRAEGEEKLLLELESLSRSS